LDRSREVEIAIVARSKVRARAPEDALRVPLEVEVVQPAPPADEPQEVRGGDAVRLPPRRRDRRRHAARRGRHLARRARPHSDDAIWLFFYCYLSPLSSPRIEPSRRRLVTRPRAVGTSSTPAAPRRAKKKKKEGRKEDPRARRSAAAASEAKRSEAKPPSAVVHRHGPRPLHRRPARPVARRVAPGQVPIPARPGKDPARPVHGRPVRQRDVRLPARDMPRRRRRQGRARRRERGVAPGAHRHGRGRL
jgi:hypothetical protein